MNYVTLNNGIKMPMEGFGVYTLEDPSECKAVVLNAIKAGYRLFDTAELYKNEEFVGAAIRESGVKREEFFVVTKAWIHDMGYEKTKVAIENSLKRLDIGYIDLFLIHQPMGDIHGAYRAMEEAYDEGKIRALGVSNFFPHLLADFCLSVNITPAVNQVELHPLFAQEKALENMKKLGVFPMAWCPLARGRDNIFENEILTEIAKKYGKSVSQVMLRWNIDRGVSIIPKTSNNDRIIENIDIWDFSLTADEISQISSLDTGKSNLSNHFDPDFVRNLYSIR